MHVWNLLAVLALCFTIFAQVSQRLRIVMFRYILAYCFLNPTVQWYLQ